MFNDLALKDGSINIPGNTLEKFPKICKYTNSCSSHNLHDLCHDQKAVEEKVAWMKDLEPQRDVFTQDYIIGDECSAVVIELGRETAIALTPLEYKFPKGTKDSEAFLTWKNKFEGVEKGNVQYGFVMDEPRRSALQKAAASAFKIARQGKAACMARVDMRYERATGEVYVIEIGNPPVVFYPVRNSLGDDLVVEKTFPGGQLAFFDLLLLSRHLQLGQASPLSELHTTSVTAARVYDSFTERTGMLYDDIALKQPYYRAVKSIVDKCEFAGKTALDLGCGTGIFGRALNDGGKSVRITGVDISKGMVDCEIIRHFYEDPIIIEEIQSYVMNDVHFDHVVCFGILQFLHPVELNAVLARIFQIANASVSIMVDEYAKDHIEQVFKQHRFRTFNLIEAVKRFGVPPGWKLKMDEKAETFFSPTAKKAVMTTLMHFEKDEGWTPVVPPLNPETGHFVDTHINGVV